MLGLHFHCIYFISFSKAFRFGRRRSDWFACNFQPASVPPLSSFLWLTCFGGSSRGSIHLGVRYKQALKSSVVLISWSCSYVWCDCVMFIFQWVHAVSGHSANHLTLVLLPRAMSKRDKRRTLTRRQKIDGRIVILMTYSNEKQLLL